MARVARAQRRRIQVRSAGADRTIDFVCRKEKLIVEVDGATHSTDAELQHDLRRAGFLTAQGYRILRVTNEDIYRNLDGVLETVLAKLTVSPSS
jgi:very-short-patch-repair endonuclease